LNQSYFLIDIFMTFDNFKTSLGNSNPPQELTGPLKALWFDAQGQWNQAHLLVQEVGDSSAAWVHAYLHRKEGDLSNASYWYSRAGKSMPKMPLEDEWEDIARKLLDT
jgi:hypothetical protein